MGDWALYDSRLAMLSLQGGWSGGSSLDQSRHLRRLAKGGVSTLGVMCTCLGRRSRSRSRRRRKPPAPAELAEVALRPLRRRRKWLTASAQRHRRGARQLTGYRPAFLEGEPTRLTIGERGPRVVIKPDVSAVRRSIQRRRFSAFPEGRSAAGQARAALAAAVAGGSACLSRLPGAPLPPPSRHLLHVLCLRAS